MQAVILAAGFGSRLSSVTGGKAKALVEIGGRPLILHQLEALADHGVGPVVVVVGHQADEIQRVVGERAEVILNDRFAETNSLYSLWLARDWITGPFVLLNCDLFFDPLILDQLLEESGNVLAYDSTSSRGREQTKVALKKRRVVDLGKDLPASSARGESLGMLKFETDGAKAMLDAADQLIRDGNANAWVIEATRAVCGQVPVFGVNIAGGAWAEIDFPYDLDVARREVWPQIWRGRWRKQVYWRRTRWMALGGAAVGLALLGWLASALIGPGSLDWETVPIAGRDAVSVERAGKGQRWWEVGLGSTVVAEVSGSRAAVEVRLILPDSTTDSLQYVVSVVVDGSAEDWRALTATRDSSAHIRGDALGDRDRIALELPAGRHQVAVTLAAGHAGRMLVRVRQPEQRQD
jgi:choline kinase